jgi:hypothetical protein
MENHAGNAPPSSITYATRRSRAAASYSPHRIGGSAECRSATTTGIPSTESASRNLSWNGESCSSAPSTVACNGV